MAKLANGGIAALALLWPGAAGAAPVACSTVIAGHIAWMGQGPAVGGQIRRRIGAKLARVKITSGAPGPATTPWGHVSVAEGAFGRSGNTMEGRFMVAFSDRGFDPARRDITDITLSADGTGQVMLRSWGNALIPLSDLRCDSAGFLTALEREANGTSLITFSLRRETF